MDKSLIEQAHGAGLIGAGHPAYGREIARAMQEVADAAEVVDMIVCQIPSAKLSETIGGSAVIAVAEPGSEIQEIIFEDDRPPIAI